MIVQGAQLHLLKGDGSKQSCNGVHILLGI